MPPLFELRDVTVHRGGTRTLHVDSLVVERGEVLALIGPNGAGKSTLLQVFALLLPPSSGSVTFEGVPIKGDTLPYRRRMAISMQEALLLHGSVMDNVSLGLKLRGVQRRERLRRSSEWLERFGIAGLASRSAYRLSGGEAQRASLARAFVLEPDVLLLDEPFGGLDPPTRDALLADLARILRQTQLTTIFVTHDRDEARQLAGRISVLIDGRVHQTGSAGAVFTRPVDEKVAAFVGIDNILDGRVIGQEHDVVRVAIGEHVVLASGSEVGAKSVAVCLKSEDVSLSLHSDGRKGVCNELDATITRVRPSGSEIRVDLDCGVPIVASMTRRVADEIDARPGMRVLATFDSQAVFLISRSGT